MSGLWRKELRSILPFLSLAVILPLFGILFELSSGAPHLKPWSTTYEEYVASSQDGAFLVLLFVFALASGLLVREYDEGTMEFLDSLPVSRTRVFFVKVTIALLVVLLLVLLDAGTTWLLHALSRTSLDKSFHLTFWLTAVAMRMCQGFIVLSIGLSFSFFRRFGWLLLGLLIWLYILLHEAAPAIAVLNVLSLSRPEFEGQRWVIPVRMLLIQLTLGVTMMLVAYGLFLGWGDAIMRGFRRVAQTRFGSAVLLTGSLLVGVVGFSLAYYRMETDPDINDGSDVDEVTIEYPSWTTSRAISRNYEFIYPTNMARRALPLVEAADGVHDRVRQFFDAEAGDPILVDATSMLARHAGLAYWDKIRLDLTVTDDAEMLESILGHETTHIFLDRLSDSRLSEQFSSTRFFHEGVATYVEYRWFEPSQSIDVLRRVAAVMRDRDEVHFEELADDSQLSERRDGNLVYPLGEVFVTAVVHRYGEDAIGKIVRALVRDDAPENLSGTELWRDVFQACDYSLDSVLNDFYVMLDEEVRRHRKFIDRLPRLRGALEVDDVFVTLIIVGDDLEGWKPICRFRQARDSEDRSYVLGTPTGDNSFVVGRDVFPGASVWYQIGLTNETGSSIYEPWTRVQLRE